ncbi:MAG: helix-hairpin-helix domain-containing protein [Desulfuromonadaceae bacterium]|nr:helix-hairpin-helix domain-containing protein [Desulfuromonadaceae bacterium]
MPCSTNWSRIKTIKTIKTTSRGPLLLAVVALILYSLTFGRATLRDSRVFPAVPISVDHKIWIAHGDGFRERIVRQYNDETTAQDVMKMAGMAVDQGAGGNIADSTRLQNGQTLSVVIKNGGVAGFKVEWMPAAQRMSLGIPLHPDRMKKEDWEQLPGIGEKMATRIILDRHKNGDFVSIEGLNRVKGVGNALIARWKEYFR